MGALKNTVDRINTYTPDYQKKLDAIAEQEQLKNELAQKTANDIAMQDEVLRRNKLLAMQRANFANSSYNQSVQNSSLLGTSNNSFNTNRITLLGM